MILKALKYKSTQWYMSWSIVSGTTKNEFVEFENINLIVGRNASGKTRMIEALRHISDILDSDSKMEIKKENATTFEVIFQDGQDKILYNTEIDKNESILEESLVINGVTKLDRAKGQLFYQNLGQFLDFDTNNKFLAIRRRDNIQQPFFEILHNWGKKLAHYCFGGNMGKGELVGIRDGEKSELLDFKNSNKVIHIYKDGKENFGDLFEKNIIKDMRLILYEFNSISLIKFTDNIYLKTQEVDLPFSTYFENMSQGMARAFSLIVQLNYSLMAKIPSCILIDDIGEGLDYERSKSLIDLIVKKVEGSSIQLFMTTNDRFVMNSVPLKYWSVIHREGNKSVFYNYQNSKQTFDDFAFTGLNNFDFFATEFYRQGFEEFIATAQ